MTLKIISEKFLQIAHNTSDEEIEVPDEFQAFAAAKNFPSRIDCATLSWDEFLEFLKNI